MSKEFELLNRLERCDSTCSSSPPKKLLSAFEERDIDRFVKAVKNSVRSKNFNINHYYDDTLNGTLLELACRSKNACEFVKVLIEYGAELNVVNKVTKKAPIHVVIENSNTDTLNVLIECKTVDVNIADSFGNTALHIAAKRNDLQCIEILFKHPSLNINKANRKCQTPLHLALAHDNEEAVRFLLNQFNIDLDGVKNLSNKTCREIIMEKYPHLKIEMTKVKRETDVSKTLFTFLHNRDFTSFKRLVKVNNHCLNENDGELTYLQYACRYGLSSVVDMLLDAGADPNACCPITQDRPAIIAANRGYCNILRKLLDTSDISLEPVNGKTILHAVMDGFMDGDRSSDDSLATPLEEVDHSKCLEYVLQHIKKESARGKLDINYQDDVGNTVLHYAVKMNDDKMVKTLLEAGAYIHIKNNAGLVPLHKINAKVLEEYLDGCITTNGKRSRDLDYQIIFDYSLLIPPRRYTSLDMLQHQPVENGLHEEYDKLSETEPLLLMSNLPELRKLLKHPVLTSFLYLKWYAVRKYFFINLIFYLAFWLVLTSYILYIYGSSDNKNLASNATDAIKHFNAPENVALLWYVTFLLCGGLFLRELFQFSVSPWTYLKSPENWLEILLIIITAAVLTCQNSFDQQPQLAAVAILASWMELILLIGRHPLLSTNIEMFKTVTINFLKFLAWYSILILAFAFSFYILFKDGTSQGDIFFRDPAMSIFKSVIMLTGEFDAGSIPFGSELSASHLLFVLFIFLIAIVLFNLLNGLAVSDTQAIRADAELVGHVSRVKLISYVERIAISDPLPCLSCLDKLRCLCCCVPIQQASLHRRKHRDMFYKRISLFPHTITDGKVSVLPNQGNLMLMKGPLVKNAEYDGSCSFIGNILAWNMDPNIIKVSERILEEKNKSDVEFRNLLTTYSRQLEEFKAELQIIRSNSINNEKLLLEVKEMIKQRL